MEHSVFSVDNLDLPTFNINSKEDTVTIYRLIGRPIGQDWESMEKWLKKHKAVETAGHYVTPNHNPLYTQRMKIASRWTVTPELLTMFLLRWL